MKVQFHVNVSGFDGLPLHGRPEFLSLAVALTTTQSVIICYSFGLHAVEAIRGINVQVSKHGVLCRNYVGVLSLSPRLLHLQDEPPEKSSKSFAYREMGYHQHFKIKDTGALET